MSSGSHHHHDNGAKAETNLLSKIFRRGSKQPEQVTTDDANSTMSGDTLVPRERVKSISQEMIDEGRELMEKANTMSEEDFKKYLAEHKEEIEAYYKAQGGGISSGEWIVPGVPMGFQRGSEEEEWKKDRKGSNTHK
ncbi:uncharacterized protein Z520_06645 [Fonsecaea multimorphosa CBS 102226]|uniref:Uncharacterized protein n=1 Tax=Fonsecaea multimorphosa CBS 102226 TaxID=1442371 RepID=A0A0D2JWH3_9EURO|nr:uncharacterized protein Z520_06645 [Fonsecaea multimorphosa CBS 102226]KIX97867.1 hypothetical protein Z520_06645 [Fonsecaea multimorphosa CBS 102226]OAL23635.1 hypothetical protein AYO22_06212 [Fonsecaea multimorphosa]